jgi:quinol monooxygenase YgiN
MVRAAIRMMIPSRKRDEVLEILSSIAERTGFEPGCISCRVYQGAEVENLIMLEEVWRDEEDLECQLWNANSHLTGFETIEKAKSSPRNGKRS